MILQGFKDFPRNGRLLGIDWGARRIGTAVSTPDVKFVFARGIVGADNIRPIIDLINEERIVGIVIGLPLFADGSDSKTTVQVRKFADDLAAVTDVPIVFIEENLTSIEATERQKEKGKSIKEIDSESAKIILENAIAVMRRM